MSTLFLDTFREKYFFIHSLGTVFLDSVQKQGKQKLPLNMAGKVVTEYGKYLETG